MELLDVSLDGRSFGPGEEVLPVSRYVQGGGRHDLCTQADVCAYTAFYHSFKGGLSLI